VLRHEGSTITVESLPAPNEGDIHMSLTYTGTTVQGTWKKPLRQRATTKEPPTEVLFNTGDWELVLQEKDLAPETIQKYSGKTVETAK
jgi:hypothetical protein